MLNPITVLILTLLDIYWYVVIAAVVVSWLIVFRVINISHPIVRSAVSFLYAITEPVFRLVRRVIPPFGGIDIAPMIVIIALGLIEYTIKWSVYQGYLG